jgi:hypothetical protein
LRGTARVVFGVGLLILLSTAPAYANMGFVMPPISVPVMISILILIVGLSILSGEAVLKTRRIMDRGQGDIWFRVLGIPGILALGMHILLKSLRVMTGPSQFILIFAVVVFFQLSRLHSSAEAEADPDTGKAVYETYLLPVLAAVTVISPVLFWFIGGFTHLFLQVGLTGFWTWYGCRYGFLLLENSARVKRGSYSSWAMRISGYILIPACIVIAMGHSHAAYRTFRFPADQVFRWQAAKANVDQLRSALASYAADSDTNQYPVGEFNYNQIKTLLPQANLPNWEEEARWEAGSFIYSSENGTTFSIKTTAMTREQNLIYGSPSDVTPRSYPY